MSDAIHARFGLWLLPAPGFRLRRPRRRRQQRREPPRRRHTAVVQGGVDGLVSDAVGVISCNQYSTYIEPRRAYQARYLDILGEFTGSPQPAQAREPVAARPPYGAFGRAIVTASVVVGFVLLVT